MRRNIQAGVLMHSQRWAQAIQANALMHPRCCDDASTPMNQEIHANTPRTFTPVRRPFKPPCTRHSRRCAGYSRQYTGVATNTELRRLIKFDWCRAGKSVTIQPARPRAGSASTLYALLIAGVPGQDRRWIAVYVGGGLPRALLWHRFERALSTPAIHGR